MNQAPSLRHIGLIAVAAVAVISGPATARATSVPIDAFPVTVSSCGRESTFDEAPSRVVVGWPTSIDTLTALGVADRVIGYTSGDFAPTPEGAPNAVEVSPDYQAAREVVLATGTDFFLTNDENQLSGNEGGLGYDDLAGLDAGSYVLGGYCIGIAAPTGIQVVYDDITNLGAIFGIPDVAGDLNAELQERAAAARIDDRADAPSIAVVQIYDGTLYALTGSYYKMAVDAVGFDNVFDDSIGNFAEISAEQVLTLAPDVLAVAYENEPGAEQTAIDDAREVLASSPAVLNDRIVTLSSADLGGGGVTLFDVIDQLSAVAQPS